MLFPREFGTIKRRGEKFGFDLDLTYIWEVATYISIVLTILNMSAYLYYRMVISESKKIEILRIGLIVVFPCIVYLITFGYTYVFEPSPVWKLKLLSIDASSFEVSHSNNVYHSTVSTTKIEITADMGLFVCFLLPMVLVGSYLFSIFAGAGLGFLPVRIINEWLNTPVKPNPLDHVLSRRILLDENKDLIRRSKETRDILDEMKMGIYINDQNSATMDAKYKKLLFKLKRDLIDYEKRFQVWTYEDKMTKNNVLKSSSMAIAGVCTAFTSFIIVLHICFSFMGIHDILQSIILKLEKYSNVLSLFLFGSIMGYIVISMAYGTSRMSYILSGVFDSHPMKLGATWSDTSLLVVCIILPGTIGMLAFVGSYIPEYFRYLSINELYIKVISKLPLMRFMIKVQVFGYLLVFFFMFGVFYELFLENGKMALMKRVLKKKEAIEKNRERVEILESLPQIVSMKEEIAALGAKEQDEYILNY
jgi:hypothetical protein